MWTWIGKPNKPDPAPRRLTMRLSASGVIGPPRSVVNTKLNAGVTRFLLPQLLKAQQHGEHSCRQKCAVLVRILPGQERISRQHTMAQRVESGHLSSAALGRRGLLGLGHRQTSSCASVC